MRTLLTPDGVRYTVEHERLVELVAPLTYGSVRSEDGAHTRISAKGGITTVKVYDADDNEVLVTTAVCSERENFNAKRGHLIALGRALCELSGEADRRRTRRLEAAFGQTIEELSAEAERGYDVSKLKPRNVH